MDLRDVKWDIVGRRAIWFTLSGLVIAAGIVGLRMRGLNLGIDFTGGAMYTFRVGADLSEDPVGNIAKARRIASEAGIGRAQVQVYGKNEFLIRTTTLTNDEAQEEASRLQEGLAAAYDSAEQLSVELVGPVIGKHLRNTAVIALIIGCGLILLYITIRYELSFAVAGVLALVHDVLITVGACALTGTEVNSPFVAAILTVIGYSINDSVIIFDRIRENWRLRGREEAYADVVNRSLWQTMTRSINTSGTTLITLFMIYAFGGPTIRDFAFTLLVGLFCGAYSSIFFAAPLVVVWRQWAERRAPTRAGRRTPAAAPPVRERRRERRAERSLDRPLVEVGPANGDTGEAAPQDQPASPRGEGAAQPAGEKDDSAEESRSARQKRKAPKRGKRKKRY